MGVFSPYFDSKTAWYSNAQVYQDMYAIYYGSALASQHPEWILRDAYGNLLFIPWDCNNGVCTQYAADISNPAFRAWWIGQMQQIQSRGNYRGLWIDDVNTNFNVGDGYGNLVTPIDNSTGLPMTWTNWRYYVAQFVEQIRQAFPNREILHNSVWFAGPDGVRDADPAIQEQTAAANIINMERGIASDPGLTGGTGDWSVYAQFAYIDRMHQAGHPVVLEDYTDTVESTQLYSLAAYYMISSGYDYYGDTSTTPANWWSGLTTNIGAPLGPRTYNNGVYQRNFSNGIALLGEPGLAPQTVNLPATFTTIDGVSVNSVTISAAQGIILLGAYPNASIPALSVNTSALRAATAGAFYSAGLSVSGGSGPYSFSISGAPAGMTITGTAITGTPNAGGTYNILVTAKDNSTGATAQRTLPLTVYAPLSITNAPANGAPGVSYSSPLTASGGSGNYLWTISNAPTGLVISGNTLTGTPTTAGTYSNVIVTVMDTSTAVSVQKTFTITIGATTGGSTLAITTSTLPGGTAGSAYSAALTASGGSGNYAWSASGLPPGIAVSGSNLAGTPTTAGTYSVSVTVSDTTTGVTAQKTFSMAISGGSLAITLSALPSATVGTAYSANLTAAGGSGTYSWAATGLPAGLAVSGSTIAGTPTTAGTYSVIVTVTDGGTGLTAQNTYTLNCAANQPGAGTWVTLGAQIAGHPAVIKGSDGTLQAAVRNASNSAGDFPQSGSYAWQAEIGLGGSITSNAAIGINNNAGAEIFARGTDNAVWTITQSSTGGSFGKWSSLGGKIISDPSVLRSGNGALHVFATASNNTVWQTAQNAAGGTWTVQTSLGGSIAGTPVAITNTDGTIEVFARGTDNALWHNRQSSSGGAWGGWSSFGGLMIGDPAAGMDTDGRVEVFVLGTDHSIWHLAQTSGASRSWTSWNGFGGYSISNPATARDADGRLELYVGGSDNTLWYRAQTLAGSTSWTTWTGLGGNVADTIAAVANGIGAITVVTRGTDNLPRARTQVAAGTW